MSLIVFCGSTLAADEVRSVIEADVRPPAALGDVYRAACERPRAIGIIDGLFLHTPAVWHKEILWAMSEGVHVFGAASMGALRAAELAAFGMEGVGEIFRAFRDGELEDDDEVTVAHAEAGDGWRPLSDAMVDIRATLRAAAAGNVVDEPLAAALIAIAKRLPYPSRLFEWILRCAVEQRAATVEQLAPLRAWLPEGRVRQKRADALALLERMRAWAVSEPAPRPANFVFEHTDAWEEVRVSIEEARSVMSHSADEALVEELQLSGAFVGVRDGAAVRGQAIEEARRRGLAVDEVMLRDTIYRFRCERELRQPEAFDRWLTEEGLHGAEGVRFFADEALARIGRGPSTSVAGRYLVDHLRATGDRLHFAERARAKRELLAAHGLDAVTLEDARISEQELWAWFFEIRLGRAIPADVRAWAVAAGFEDDRALRAAVLREHAFVTRQSG